MTCLTVSMGLHSGRLSAKRRALWSTHLLLELFYLITLSKALPASNERGIGVQQNLLRVPPADEQMTAGSVSSSKPFAEESGNTCYDSSGVHDTCMRMQAEMPWKTPFHPAGLLLLLAHHAFLALSTL